ncbi:hypothetical protein Thaha01_00751 [Tetragenococcus halophilus subsp. halophilus]
MLGKILIIVEYLGDPNGSNGHSDFLNYTRRWTDDGRFIDL